MTCFTHQASPIQVHRPNNCTQSKANNQTEGHDEKERYHDKDQDINPHIDYIKTATIGRYEIACKRNDRSIKHENKNSCLNK